MLSLICRVFTMIQYCALLLVLFVLVMTVILTISLLDHHVIHGFSNLPTVQQSLTCFTQHFPSSSSKRCNAELAPDFDPLQTGAQKLRACKDRSLHSTNQTLRYPQLHYIDREHVGDASTFHPGGEHSLQLTHPSADSSTITPTHHTSFRRDFTLAKA